MTKNSFAIQCMVMTATAMEFCLNQLNDLANTTLVPCYTWTLWFLMHVCFGASKVSPSAPMYAHWTIWDVLPSSPSHGLLPDQDIAGAPWEETAVDLTGPWPASTSHGTVEFFTLICSDTTTNLVKITLLPILSIPGSLGILDQCRSFMTREESS